MKNKNQIIIPFCITLIVFSPIFAGNNFLLFSTDNLFGSLPGIQFSKILKSFGESIYFPFSLRGIDFSASINNFTNSLFFKPFIFFPTSLLYSIIFFEIILCYFFIGYLSYKIIYNILNSKFSAIFGGTVVQLSSCTIFYLQTFPNIFLFTVFLALILVLQNYEKNSFFLNVLLSTVLLWLLIVTGHISYAFYFCFFIFVIFCHYLFLSKKKYLFFSSFLIAIIFSLLLSLNKIVPIFLEILDGSRMGNDFVRTDFFSPFRYLVYYLSDIYGSSIYKMQYLGNAHTNLGSKINPNNVVEMYMGHGAFVYSGIISVILSIFHIFYVKKYYLWKFISFFYLLFNISPFFSNISNVFFYPFHHGSINYISGFFLAISASIGIEHLIKNKNQIQKFKDFIIINSKLFIFIFFCTFIYLFIYVASIEPKTDFENYTNSNFYFLVKYIFNLDVYLIKVYTLFLSFILIIVFYFILFKKKLNFFGFKNNYNISNSLIFIISISLLYFLTPIGRFCLSSFLLLYLFLWFYDYKKFDLYPEDKHYIVISYCFLLILIFFMSKYLILDKIPIFYTHSEDYPNNDYFRIRNGFSNRIFWQFEWLILIFIGVLKYFYIINFSLSKLIQNLSEKKIFLLFFIILTIDAFPNFLNKIFWISKPYVSFDYDEFEKSKRKLNIQKNFDYRYNFVNKSIPITNLNHSEWESELISNFPYIYELPSYGGLNSQLTIKFENFMQSYVENKKILYGKTSKPNFFSKNNFGLASDYEDKRLLEILGVKFDLSNQNDLSEYFVNPNAIARFTLFHNFVQVKDEFEAGKRLSDLSFNINKFVTIQKDVATDKIVNNNESKKLNYTHIKSFDKIRVITKNKCLKECVLLFNDNFNQNWKAFSENFEYEIFPANGISMGILINKNTEYVDFSFNNEIFAKLNNISKNSQIALFVLIFLFLFQKFFTFIKSNKIKS